MQNFQRLRSALVVIHRYSGLFMAVFLIIAGLTGSVITFYREFDKSLNPELFLAEERGPALSLSELSQKIEAAYPQARTSFMRVGREPGESVLSWITPRTNPQTGKPFELPHTQVFVHPVTGDILGGRQFGVLSTEKKDLIPFLYKLHYKLHLPEKSGMWLMGGVAMLLTLNCLIAFYLAIPQKGPLWKAFGLSWNGDAGRFNFDLHRAAGLWFWAVLLVIGFTSVYLNLRVEVFTPAVELFSPVTKDPIQKARALSQPLAQPAVDWNKALVLAQAALRKEGGRETKPDGISLDYKKGIYRIRFHSDQDIAYYGDTRVYIDATSGENKGILRRGDGTAGDTIMQWQYPLHSGQALGMAGRIVVFIAGLVTALLSITGIVVWLGKRKRNPGRIQG
ncbi:MAG: PepSY domain-containing protein [Polaromonas sp.]|uniref:PepSY-associated TM helix domain-containing protein n=1 Tax=Polaromonas sp. TaxID=1869339 RepID=UPI00180CB4E7|nr:PepSY-associated TM helix domain-containing protein [Polaromonas sp.]MBA3595247.1 PepSY domain-containing protein [Polaromonas sp.]